MDYKRDQILMIDGNSKCPYNKKLFKKYHSASAQMKQELGPHFNQFMIMLVNMGEINSFLVK